MEQFLNQLKKENIGVVKEQESLANHTTWRIGGPADVLVEPDGLENLKRLMELVNEHQVEWRVIGRGSNLLVADGGIEGVVIKLGKGMDHLKIDEDVIKVGGGYPLIKLATLISREGLSGLEFAGGIPGSVGGAVFMNAGAHGSDISKILKEALILFPDGRLEWIKAEEMGFSYRTSRLQKEKGICVEAIFQLEKGEKEEIVKHMQANKDYRRDSQPWKHPTCGSVFRNPLPNYAGQLIEEAGLKGFQIGGAQISPMHANFIVNVEDAKAQDVLDLITHVKETIKTKHNIEIETEVEMIGRSKENEK
ncbi:UDP-N-acetylmuramate dehydrogenase [Halalkalibacter akibai]|uniref:UDP-N-acetylenolpyruvoylglucosamine reductase n=1 Tax=Halalkalibacter akibai (strain ATCC 43226 / DSM 21942 / CIP 109018 / JCM 9157 / 1139) TaxID=1236973 RepID=W4QQC9_HALA3|nr:UDP-N-acetylmuramate dehydrogenase [Halalkalibacter akibai]GAE33858.1 UDP-N-acetylenolpyruvoylglucosamine reductase [Halalkalibacter akibai JCM 9157]